MTQTAGRTFVASLVRGMAEPFLLVSGCVDLAEPSGLEPSGLSAEPPGLSVPLGGFEGGFESGAGVLAFFTTSVPEA